MWSEDLQDFIVAGELTVGENLRKSDGTRTQVTRINRKTGPPVNVYNLEIDGEHVYHVGGGSVLVHNGCGGAANPIEGMNAEKALAQSLKNMGLTVYRNALARTAIPGFKKARRQIDLVVQISEDLYALEVKSGKGILSAGQIWKDKAINAGGSVLFGRNATAAKIDGKALMGIIEVHVP